MVKIFGLNSKNWLLKLTPGKEISPFSDFNFDRIP